MRAFALISIAAFTAAGCAPQPMTSADPGVAAAAGARQCFSARTVNGFQEVSDRAVDLTVSADQVYRAELFGTCPDVDSAQGVGIRTRSGSNFICNDMDLELVVPAAAGGSPQRCLVRTLRRLSPEEVAAQRGSGS